MNIGHTNASSLWLCLGFTVTVAVGIPLDAQSQYLINEIRVDEPGDDQNEFIELYGPANTTSPNDLMLVVLGDSGPGGSGVVEALIPVGSAELNSAGFVVFAESSFQGAVSYVERQLNFENLDTLTFFLVLNSTAVVDEDLDTNDDGTLDLQPWDSILDSVSLVAPNSDELPYSGNQVGENVAPGHVSRCFDG
ncbi:MAG: hypothetical protein VX223_04360, partial [Myxococcota bacterium]|nr:hypothetical protein [Myxococcota bacterium]